jgi:hypothetical protein
MSVLHQAARLYSDHGLSVVIVNSRKEPVHSWKICKHRILTIYSLQQLLLRPAASGLAIVAGSISNNLVVIDVDVKNDPTGMIGHRLLEKLLVLAPQVRSRLVIVSTPSTGFHFYYRAPFSIASSVLARNQHSATNIPFTIGSVLIEIRGEGDYAVVPPTPGYHFLQGDLLDLPVLSVQEHDTLIACCSSFDCTTLQADLIKQNPVATSRYGSPFDDFNTRGDVLELLAKHGWKIYPSKHSDPRTYLQRPGNAKNKTSANYHHGLNLLRVFSTQTDFSTKQAYKPYAVFAILECQSDFKLAARKLIEQGYGISYIRQRQPNT